MILKLIRGIVLFILLNHSLHSIGQVDASWDQAFIQKISKYRTELLQREDTSAIRLKGTLKRWQQLEPNEDIFETVLVNAYIGHVVLKYELPLLKLLLKDFTPNSGLINFISDKHLESLEEHSALVKLIMVDALKPKYPYQISLKKSLLKEIEFYGIENNDKLAEIGVGLGTFSQLLGLLDKNLTIYVNEIWKPLLVHLKNTKGLELLPTPGNNLVIIEGTKRQCNIPEKVNKIIIRNSFHHFSKKKKMLNSLRKSLKYNGKLFLFETLRNEDDPDNCKEKMSEEDLKHILIKNNFYITREIMIDGTILLECTPSTYE